MNAFDWKIYIANYEDLQKAGICTKEKAYQHWIKYGKKEGRTFKDINNNDKFNWTSYIDNYEDLQKAGINTKEKAYQHWMNYGIKEGRTYIMNIYRFADSPIFQDYILHNDLQDRIFYTGYVPFDVYNEIISGCDIGLQIRPGNNGGVSGSVIDCLSVDLPVITVQDIIDSLNINNELLIGYDINQYDDWVSIKNYNGGYSDKLTKDISERLLSYINNKTTISDNKISKIINERLHDYPKKLIDILSIKHDHKLAFVTPYPPDLCGVADFTYSTIQELSKYVKHIDIFTDADITGDNIYKIDEILLKHKIYSKIIYTIGNSPFHAKIISCFNILGGVCILHDERLGHLYRFLGKLPSEFVVDDEKGHTSLCFDEIITANPLIVHSKKLQTVIKNIYKKDIEYIPFCSFNKLKKYNYDELNFIKKIYKINGDINIVINGSIKYPFQALKITEYLKKHNVICKIFFVGQ